MLVRAIALSLALIIGVGVIVPLATEYVQAGHDGTAKKYKKKKHRKYKKYSKAWWRQYKARQKRKKALAARRRALRLRQLRLAKLNKAKDPASVKQAEAKAAEPQTSAVLPSGQAAPQGWKASKLSSGEILFQIDGSNGATVGTASISVVGPAMGEDKTTGRNPMLAGVPVTSLRREVINRMIRENGWVVNDYQKEVAGRNVYVVVAQSQAGSRVNSRMFYFTDADGRIYSVATTSAADSAEKLAEESEKVIQSLRPRPLQAAVKE